MKHIMIIGLYAAGLVLGGCGSKGVDHADPASVTTAIFTAASSGDTSKLKGLCDPKGQNDGDTRRVCEMTPDNPKWDGFKKYFAKGKVVGKPEIDGQSAKVKFKFGPDGTRDEEMRLVLRDGKWYLSGF